MIERNHPRPIAEDWFWSKVDKGDGTGCWLWTGPRSNNGYGRYGRYQEDAGPRYAHRIAYELLVGPIPDGLTLDHVKANGCTSKLCVKAIADEHGPTHLEAVTTQENTRRHWVGYDTCRHGHPYDEANTYRDSQGRRFCRICNLERGRRLKGYQGGVRPERRTHCPKGHPYDEANTYWYRGHRSCRECGREKCRRRWRQRKAES